MKMTVVILVIFKKINKNFLSADCQTETFPSKIAFYVSMCAFHFLT